MINTQQTQEQADLKSKQMLAELCDIWYDMPIEAQASSVYGVARRVYLNLPRTKKIAVAVAVLVASAFLIYISSENWAFAFLLGALVMLITLWAIKR